MSIFSFILSPFTAMKARKELAKYEASLPIKKIKTFNESNFSSLNPPDIHISFGVQLGYNSALDYYYTTGLTPERKDENIKLDYWTKYKLKGKAIGHNRAIEHIEEYKSSLIKN